MRRKYGNEKVSYDGMIFDSKKEYKRYRELLLLERAGAIHDLQRQVKFILIHTQREPDRRGPRGGVIKGKLLEKEVSYIADFVYLDGTGKKVVEDTKGMRTKEYIIKRKLMLHIYGIKIIEL